MRKMPTSRDWDRRIESWCEAVSARLTRPLAELEVQFAGTLEHLSPARARRLRFRPIRPGRRWGRKWEYGWFRARPAVPKAAPGRAVVLEAWRQTAPEAIVFLNGRAAGGLGPRHRHIDLSAAGAAGRRVEILVEAYAGHGGHAGRCPFVLPGREPFAPARPPLQVFEGFALREWDERAYQLLMDVRTLVGLTRSIDGDSLRWQKLTQALRTVTTVLDPEAPEEQFQAAIAPARRLLRPLLAAGNGPTMPEMYCVGHSHIDVAWLWPLAQTFRKSAATFSTVLALMERYRELRFLQSQAQLYEFLKAQYPVIYARIKRAVRRGQWIADGGMWVEPDTNVAGGEALIRQFLYGKRFFRDEFGVDSRFCWLPDVFGYSANLPQILLGCGMQWLSTQKIFWNLHGGTTFPYENFLWQGIDGSEVRVHLHRDYNARTDPESVAARWRLCAHKEATEKMLYPFGYGDGGGGPTRDHLEHLRRQRDLEGLPRMRIAAPDELLGELERTGPPEDRYAGELYLELHRGTYTSQARTKRFNRKCELALREAEMWSAVAAEASGQAYPAAELERLWKAVLLNQFHDVLPGSSITRVYVEAEKLYADVLAGCRRLDERARRALVRGRDGWTVWNSLSWRRDALVELPSAAGRPVDADGNDLPAQVVARGRSRRLLVAVSDLPPVGGRSVRLAPGRPPRCPPGASARAVRGGAVMENEHLRLRIDARGEIADLRDKATGRRLVARGRALNRLELYRDNPVDWDAWDIDIAYTFTPVPLGPAESVRVVSAGPLEARVAVRRRLERSLLHQQIVLRAGSRRVDFETRVDWRTKHRLLKAAFPADLRAPVLRGEVQFGHVVRPTHRNTQFEQQRFEWPAQKWAALSEADCTVAVLNDCKYGCDVLDGVLRLTLLRCPVLPDPSADLGEQEFTYALLVQPGPFAGGQVVRAAYELNVPAAVTPGWCRREGEGFVEVSGPTAVVETVKRSEDGRATVVRLYESVGGSGAVRLRVAGAATRACDCDMLEAPLRRLPLRNGAVTLRLRPFQVRTVRFE